MNDSKELSWLYEVAKKVIWSHKYSPSRTDDEVKLCELLLAHCDNLYLDETFFPNVFCACFSKHEDSLGQWRAYANDGRGVAIGFYRKFLETFIIGDTTRLANVEYLMDSDVVQVRSELHNAFSRLKESSRPLSDDEISGIANTAELLWGRRAPLCKNAAFKEEGEVRLVHVGGVTDQMSFNTRIGPIKFFPRSDVIASCITVELDCESQPIARIGLGPRNRTEHNWWGIMEFARARGFSLARDQFYVSKASYGELRRTEKLHVPPWASQ